MSTELQPPASVLLVPGLDGSGQLFEPFIDQLGDGYRCEVVRFEDGLARFEDHVALLAAALQRAPAPVLLVAESFGGPVAIAAAARHPELVRALLLVATFVTRPTASVGMIAPLFRVVAGVPWPTALRGLVLSYMLGDRDMDRALLERLIEVNGASRAAVLAHRLRIVARVDVRADLAGLDVAVAYVAGTDDRIVPARAHADAVRRLRPDARVTLLSGAPHMVLQCRAAACAGEARALLDAAARRDA